MSDGEEEVQKLIIKTFQELWFAPPTDRERSELEPKEVAMLPELERGLALLDQADPSVQVAQLPSGEHVVRTCGEVHLERCLRDLKTTFAPNVTVEASAPIVPFREAVSDDRVGRGTATTAGKQCMLRVRAQKLPEAVAACVREHHAALRSSQQRGRSC